MSPPLDRAEALAVIEAALSKEGQHIYAPPNTSASAVEASLRAHICEPFEIKAKVMPPGFPFAEVGDTVSGMCIAQNAGYWLVYQVEEEHFLCFWGESTTHLGAHGVYGNPLYCWSA